MPQDVATPREESAGPGSEPVSAHPGSESVSAGPGSEPVSAGPGSESVSAGPGAESVRATRDRSGSRLTHAIAARTGFDDRTFVLRVVQPALVGMIDGTISTLAPIFAAAISSSSHTALVVGLATALGAGVSMGFSEALSDTGEETGRGSAVVRGAITGGATAFGGVFHSLPFIIHNVHTALIVAGIVVGIELFVISWVRYRFLHVPLRNSMVAVAGAGAVVVAIGVLIGSS